LKIAVLGSRGLIGAAIYDHLRKSHDVITIGRGAPAQIVADFTDARTVKSLPLSGVDALVHAAGIVNEDFEDPYRAFMQATSGTARLLDRAVECGISRFCYVSSAHVYGPLRGPIDEATSVNPLTDYAIAHFSSEQIVRRMAVEGRSALVVRPCAVFGMPPDLNRFRRWDLIPFGFPRDAVTANEIVLKTSGKQFRNFVSTTDIASVIGHWLLQSEVPAYQVINPLGATSLTVLEFSRLCAEVYEALTGRVCAVRAPVIKDDLPDDFRYLSRYPQPGAKADLSKAVKEFMRALMSTD
jgi:UDP-glucose 4-epimerase